jgi:hypothetical protein
LSVKDELFTDDFQVVLAETVHSAVMIAFHFCILRF